MVEEPHVLVSCCSQCVHPVSGRTVESVNLALWDHHVAVHLGAYMRDALQMLSDSGTLTPDQPS